MALSASVELVYPRERRSVIWEGELVRPSTLTKEHFMTVYREKVGEDVARISNWYDLNRDIFYSRGIDRKSGEPYFNHPASVAMNGMQLGDDNFGIVAAKLGHDTPEDTDRFRLPQDEWQRTELLDRGYVNVPELANHIGERAARIIAAVSKPFLRKKKKDCSPYELEQYYSAKCEDLLLFTDVSDEVVDLKLGDRAHNLMTIIDPEMFERKVEETDKLLLPILRRIVYGGMYVRDSSVQSRLEGELSVFEGWFKSWKNMSPKERAELIA